ncbi:hypothetical protein CIPAW_09G068900 [Carya illinoinensis]|uniref:Secreted protein n=1 Tax=Carya illinoinensis TaxID=32201 RepID=A0A8T1PLU4_CARIL|nr:hypothetical protein CIPAW_09G068900 [Carya illinoinensis]
MFQQLMIILSLIFCKDTVYTYETTNYNHSYQKEKNKNKNKNKSVIKQAIGTNILQHLEICIYDISMRMSPPLD